jgi:sn1-specific diacylglycerol lipase
VVYYVAADHAQRALVVAIRGTMSLQDCITDALAVPVPLDQYGLVRALNIQKF